MENDSVSQSSPSWPTRWASDSFPIGWTVGFALLLTGIFFVALFVAAGIAALWLYTHHHAGDIVAAARNQAHASASVFIALSTAQVIAEAILVVVIVALMPHLTKFSLRELGFRVPTLHTLGWALLGAVGMVLVADVGSSIIQSLHPHAIHQQLVEKIFENLRNQRGGVLFFFLFASVFQPIAEETVFRVFIFNVVQRYGGFWTGAVVSGVLFGALHTLTGNADVVSGALLALGGMILCWVYYRSRNAYASMISHGLFNALSTAVLLFFPKIAGG